MINKLQNPPEYLSEISTISLAAHRLLYFGDMLESRFFYPLPPKGGMKISDNQRVSFWGLIEIQLFRKPPLGGLGVETDFFYTFYP
jgi:hypothetical protein